MSEQFRWSSEDRKPIRIGYLLYIIFFFLVCAAPLAGMLAGAETPNLEKRTLAAMPRLWSGTSLNMDFTRDFDDYFADHFTFRPYLITGWHTLNQDLFQQSGSDRVILGKSGWLFYRETLNDYLAAGTMDEIAWKRLQTVLTLEANWLEQQGIGFLFTVAPNKSTLYGGMMPDRFRPLHEAGNLELLAQKVENLPYADLLSCLQLAAAQPGQPLYHQTDSHWNNLGARIVSQQFLQEAADRLPDIDAGSLASLSFKAKLDWQGDLAVMLNPSGPRPDWQYYADQAVSFQFTKPVKSMEDIRIQTSNQAGHYRLLMFRDSFANALIPLLSGVFADALYSRSLPYDFGLAETFLPDLVILEIVERNLPQLLEQAPRLPAPAIGDHEWPIGDQALSPENLIPGKDVALQISRSGDWLQIGGRWLDPRLQSQVDRVLVALSRSVDSDRPAHYEAFPIAGADPAGDDIQVGLSGRVAADDIGDDEWRRSGGFTFYLQAGQWTAGSQNLILYLHATDGWQIAQIQVLLP